MTFDDGPTPATPALLDALAADNIKATFFIIGSQAIQFPEILRRIHTEGHQLAVHTWSHLELTTLSNEQVAVELGWTREAIREIIGEDVTIDLMRP